MLINLIRCDRCGKEARTWESAGWLLVEPLANAEGSRFRIVSREEQPLHFCSERCARAHFEEKAPNFREEELRA